ncbi:hypothetical protein FQN60_005469 [Etheostoma spectabile]|uniref:Uncharacterized protein n=1 Tax=Etheostoma spectabile TaxID=54343 RepID=A0A5J5CDB7_9PERO|nr:hypothetical protein FQN60_005469 [Etheostoma spectabile]
MWSQRGSTLLRTINEGIGADFSGAVEPQNIFIWTAATAAFKKLEVNNIMFLLAALTFALQLCLALFFMLRCWRFDNRVREALKYPEAANKLDASSSFHRDIYKQASYKLCDDNGSAALLPAVSATIEEYEPYTNSLLQPSIPWDLVQR